jgi:peptidyl-prolyl cis-trans isomerase A (cyclophilin A)
VRRLTVWGLTTFALAVALAAPGAASATTCTLYTTLGNIDVKLDSTNEPCTVNNFLSYTNSGAYNGSFFHRSVSPALASNDPDVIQGGGYAFEDGKPKTIPTQSAIANEYDDPNIADSLAMAQSGVQSTTCELDDSATDQWYFNVTDNSSGLDPDCFVVFGQAISPASDAVINKISAEPVCDVDTPFGQSPGGAFATVPLVNYNTTTYCTGTPDQTGDPPEINSDAPTITVGNLVVVTAIKILNDTSPPAITITSPLPHQTYNLGQKIPAAYACNDGMGTGVDTCTGPATVNTSLYGTLRYTVTATDYAGNAGTKTITYLVELPPTLASLGTVSSKGLLGFKLHCPSTVACAGTASLVAGKLSLLGSTRFNIRSGGTSSLRLPLSSIGWRMFRAAKWRLKAALAITPGGVGSKSFTDKVTLTRPKPKPKPKKHKKKKR